MNLLEHILQGPSDDSKGWDGAQEFPVSPADADAVSRDKPKVLNLQRHGKTQPIKHGPLGSLGNVRKQLIRMDAILIFIRITKYNVPVCLLE